MRSRQRTLPKSTAFVSSYAWLDRVESHRDRNAEPVVVAPSLIGLLCSLCTGNGRRMDTISPPEKSCAGSQECAECADPNHVSSKFRDDSSEADRKSGPDQDVRDVTPQLASCRTEEHARREDPGTYDRNQR